MSQRRAGPCGLFSRAEKEMKLSDDAIYWMRRLYGGVAHVKDKFATTFLAYPNYCFQPA